MNLPLISSSEAKMSGEGTNEICFFFALRDEIIGIFMTKNLNILFIKYNFKSNRFFHYTKLKPKEQESG